MNKKEIRSEDHEITRNKDDKLDNVRKIKTDPLNREYLLLEEYKLASRDLGIANKLLWQKTYFFMIAVTLLFSYSISEFVSEVLFLRASLSFLGLFMSIIWLLIIKRTGDYETLREKRARDIEDELKVLRMHHMAKEHDAQLSKVMKLFRERKLAKLIPFIFIVLWIAMLVYLLIN